MEWLGASKIKEICCVGAGFVGGSIGAVLATRLQNVNITVVDINQERINAWNSDKLPVSEPGLDDLIELGRSLDHVSHSLNKEQPITAPPSPLPHNDHMSVDSTSLVPTKLRFTTNVDVSIAKADLMFVCVDTPSSDTESRLGRALDTKTLFKAVQRIGEVATKDFILVEKCTVPCGTAKEVESILQKTVRPGVQFEVLSNPEFLAEGTAIQDLLSPNRVLIGSFATERGMGAATTLAELYEQWVPKDKIFTIDTWSSELSKLAANALLAQRISSINSLSMICESMNADIRTVSQSCALDDRIGQHMLSASIGFGGSCFHKDVSYLVYLAASLGLEQVARYWQAVLDMNDYQQTRFSHRITATLGEVRADETRIAILGFAFKAKTNDTRNSAAIRVVDELISSGFEVAIHDPFVDEADIWAAISEGSGKSSGRVTVCSSPYEACYRANAVVVLTEWDGFRYPSKEKTDSTVLDDGCPPTPESLDQSDMPIVDSMDHEFADRRKSKSVEDKDSMSGPQEDAGSEEVRTSGRPSRQSLLDALEATRWEQVAEGMLQPKQIFDGRNIIADGIVELGFKIERIGKMSGSLYDEEMMG